MGNIQTFGLELLKRFWWLVLILLLGASAYYFAKRLDVLRYENQRLRDNNSILSEERKHLEDGFAKTRKLTEEEFEQEYGAVIDSLDKLTDDKLKIARVLALTEFRLKHVRRDSKILWADSLIHDTIPVGRKLLFADSCMKFKVYESNNPDSAAFAVVSGEVDIKADIVFYEGKRSKQVSIFGLNIFRYGKRESDAQMFTNCGKVHLRNLEVQRK